MRPIKRAELIWLTVPAGNAAGDQFDFGVQPVLDGCWIVGFETFSATDITRMADGQAVVAAADLIRATLTLKVGSDEVISEIPLSSANAALNAGVYKEIQPAKVDFQKSYVRIATGFGTAPVAVPLLVYYWRPEEADWPNP